MASARFRALLLEGLAKFAESGYTDEGELSEWLRRLSLALDKELPTDEESRSMLARILGTVYKRDLASGVTQRVPGITRYTLDRIEPSLRAELDRRIFAAADLIKLNKTKRVQQTLQRFSGWVTAQPTAAIARVPTRTELREIAREIAKPAAQLKYEARRVGIDQGHKLSASISAVVAQGSGAIAAIWHDRGERDHGYDARPAHLARSGRLFLVRDSWAIQEGLVAKRGGVSYTDDIEMVAELPYCSCWYEYVTSPRLLPEEILTAKGKLFIRGERAQLHDSATPAQIRAGNYRKGHVRFAGLDISIENKKGELRTGTDYAGHPFEN